MSLNASEALLFVGIDWAADTHAVCVLDAAGRRVARFTVEHTAAGLTGLIQRLARLGDPAQMPVAIERPDGRLVDVRVAATNQLSARLAAFCAKHGSSGRRSGEQLLARLRAAPAGTLDDTLCEAIRDAIIALVTVLKALGAALKDIGRSVVAHLGEHPDSEIFMSLPWSGQINAAQILAEWGDCRQAYDSPDSIAALAGATPVTKESGRHRAVHFRWACNKRFRVAITTFADNSRHESDWAAGVYAVARARGHDHPHAIRVLARAWIHVIWRCRIDRTPYDPGRHGNAVRMQKSGQTELLAA